MMTSRSSWWWSLHPHYFFCSSIIIFYYYLCLVHLICVLNVFFLFFSWLCNVAPARFSKTVPWPMRSAWTLSRTSWRRLVSSLRKPTKNTMRSRLSVALSLLLLMLLNFFSPLILLMLLLVGWLIDCFYTYITYESGDTLISSAFYKTKKIDATDEGKEKMRKEND